MEKIEAFAEEWIKFRDACYPNGIDSEKERELQWAFYAGAFLATKHLDPIPEELTE